MKKFWRLGLPVRRAGVSDGLLGQRPREASRWLVLAVVLLASCASYGPGKLAVGQSSDEVVRALGMPTARYALSDGASRLEFARGPYGKHTFMVDVDAASRVSAWKQVLTEPNFDTIKPGMTSQALLLTLGTPSHRRSGGWQGGEVWSYRYQATFCQWFQVSVVEGKVRDAAYAPDPACDIDDSRRVAWRLSSHQGR